MDLGQQRERPERCRSEDGEWRCSGRGGAHSGQQGGRPEEAEKRIQGGQMSMGKHAGHDQQGPASAESGCRPPASGRCADHHSDQDRERQRGGQSAGEHVKPCGVSSQEHDLKRLAKARGQAQQPAAQGRVLRIVTEHAVDNLGSEKPPALGLQCGHVGATRTHIQRFIDGQSRIAQGQHDSQAGHRCGEQSETRGRNSPEGFAKPVCPGLSRHRQGTPPSTMGTPSLATRGLTREPG